MVIVYFDVFFIKYFKAGKPHNVAVQPIKKMTEASTAGDFSKAEIKSMKPPKA